VVTNFVDSLWFNQNALMAPGANVGPRLFVLGAGAPADTGAPDSIGLKFQTASQLYFQIGGITAAATFPTNLPANLWRFIAAVYDGANVSLYQGSETNAATLISATAASTNVNFGSSGALYIGNRQNLQRSFDGWIDDFRFYTGVADSTFVENIRSSALAPPLVLTAQPSGPSLILTWPYGTLQSAAALAGPWSDLTNASPYTLSPYSPSQFFRVRTQSY
jgi:hypothetical protein